jgi:predicted nucleic acid-binding protein
MTRTFVDANVFLRFLIQDDLEQASQAESLFRSGVAGTLELVTGPPVLFEVAWTLRSAYGHPRTQVLDALRSLMAMPGLKVLDKAAVGEALDMAETHGMDFADAYIAASARSAKAQVATFNSKDFKASGVPLRPWKAPR